MTKEQSMIHTLAQENEDLKAEIGRLRQALTDKSYELWKESYEEEHLRNIRLEEKIKSLEQPTSEDCVSRKAMLDAITEIDGNINMDIYTNEVREIIKSLPPVTPTQCIAAFRFSKDDLREICNERINIECTHGTCKDCKHWKDSDGVYRRGVGAESKCPINNSRVFDGTFYCADFEKRGKEE